MGTMDRLDFKTRRESATKRVYKGLYIVGRPLRRRTKQQSIKTKLEDPYGGFLQSNQGHQSSQQSEGKRTRGRKGGRRAASPPSPPHSIPRGVEAGNQPLSPRIRTLETKNHPPLPFHTRSYPSSSSSASSPLPATSLRFLVLLGFVKESPWAWSFAQGPR